jgi:hypothetical protein
VRGSPRSLIDLDALLSGQVEALPGEAPLFLGCAADMVAQVSSLWTPDGEHRLPDDDDRAVGPVGDDDEFDAAAEAELRAELDEARRRLADVPAAQVVANHAMGLFELAAIHLSQQPPDLAEAALAIDAMAAVVDAVGDRLAPNGAVLRDALAQIRLAFVQLKQQETA